MLGDPHSRPSSVSILLNNPGMSSGLSGSSSHPILHSYNVKIISAHQRGSFQELASIHKIGYTQKEEGLVLGQIVSKKNHHHYLASHFCTVAPNVQISKCGTSNIIHLMEKDSREQWAFPDSYDAGDNPISVGKFVWETSIFMWVSELGILHASPLCIIPNQISFSFFPFSFFLLISLILFSKLIIMTVDKVQWSPAILMDEHDEVYHCWRWKLD